VAHERLTALDAAFLAIETDASPMHVAMTLVFDAVPFTRSDGAFDLDRLRAFVRGRLHVVPLFRKKVHAPTPLLHPVWVDDARFDLENHVEHVALEPPGTAAELKRVAAELYATRLDTSRPLWHLTVVTGLGEGRRFAIVARVHHAMADGIAGVETLSTFLSPTKSAEVGVPRPFTPEPEPTLRELVRGELAHRASVARDFVRAEVEREVRALSLREVTGAAADVARGLVAAARRAVPPAPKTLINPRTLGVRRAVDWVDLDLDTLKRIRRSVDGAKLNDVVLAIVAGAVRRHLSRHGARVPNDFRVMVPVSTHETGLALSGRNEVSLLIARLPVDELDPKRRLARVVDAMGVAKAEGQSRALGTGQRAADLLGPTLVGASIRAVVRLRPYNLIVTNVPGPPVPFHLLDAELLEAHPMVPLHEHQGLGIAVLSYAGSMSFGLHADPDVVGDLDALARDIEASAGELTESCLGV
jgi:WS/DGAT/MGAT family acyltransferase